jgi:hypothetical protein
VISDLNFIFQKKKIIQIEKVWLDVHCPDFLVDEILIRAWKIFSSKEIGKNSLLSNWKCLNLLERFQPF